MKFAQKKGILLAIILLFAWANLAVASNDFSVSFEVTNNELFEGGKAPASYNVTISNNLGSIVDFRVYTLDVLEWSLYIEDGVGNMIKTYPTSSKSFLLEITPAKSTRGNYIVPVIIRSKKTDGKVNLLLPLKIISAEPLIGEYIPSIVVDFELEDTRIDPRDKTAVKVFLENKNPRNITNLEISVKSQLIDGKVQTTLGPLESKVVEIPISFNMFETPKKDVLAVRVWTSFNNESYPKKQPEPVQYEIIPYGEVKKEVDVVNKFLKKERIITVSNLANVEKSTTVRVDYSSIKGIFTRTSPKSSVVSEDGQSYLSWTFTLQPQKSKNPDTKAVVIVENYRFLFFLIVLVIVGVAAYYKLRSLIVLRKSISQIKTDEGGIMGLKVIIHLRNRSQMNIENLKIIDKVPAIVEIDKEFQIGTLKPQNISTDGKIYKIIKWEIPTLEGLEERIITYKIKSRLSVLGGFELQPAVAKYKSETGKDVIVHSNRISLVK